ncbi:hypothetical protein DXG01_015345 [Tephrocybe rancida]|nr:hypothetical protein DXG01_015345 [Tephrocybe rancida]
MIPYLHRLRELDVQIGGMSTFGVPFFVWQGDSGKAFTAHKHTSILRGVDYYYTDYERPVRCIPRDSSPVPALRLLTLKVRSKGLIDQSTFACPWHQLTHLIMVELISPDTFHMIFSQCILLQHVSFFIGEAIHYGEPVTHRKRVSFAHLDTLDLKLHSSFTDVTFLDTFTFPTLGSLKLRSETTLLSTQLDSLPESIDASCLRHLELSVGLRLTAALEFLSKCISLETLLLHFLDLSPFDILSGLSAGHPVPTLPILHEFTLCVDNRWDGNLQRNDTMVACAKLIESWWGEHCSLTGKKTFRLLIPPRQYVPADPRILFRLRAGLQQRLREWIFDEETTHHMGINLMVHIDFTRGYQATLKSDETAHDHG